MSKSARLNFSNVNNSPKLEAKSLSLVWNSVWTQKIAIALVLSAVMLIIPAIIHQQFITGPIVNACLLLAGLFVGSSEAMFLGLIPSVVALGSGTLPAPLAPMVPFIMISNSLYILVFTKLRKRNFTVAVVLASSLKFLWLTTLSKQVLKQLLPAKFITPMTIMMSWPQLATALLGGLIAVSIYKLFKRPTQQ